MLSPKCLSNIPSSPSLQTLSLVHAVVIWIPSYCHWLLFGLPIFTLASLHSILHRVARVTSLWYRSDRSLPYLCPSIASHGSQDKSQILGLVYKVVHRLAPTYLSRPTCSSPDTSTFLGSSQVLCLAPTTGSLHTQLPLPEVLSSLCFTVTTLGVPLWPPDQASCPVTCSRKDHVSPFQSPYHS